MAMLIATAARYIRHRARMKDESNPFSMRHSFFFINDSDKPLTPFVLKDDGEGGSGGKEFGGAFLGHGW
ncbi:hypothetical protein BVRB_4g087660 [Beta vulgaris subsp. vulgaris]|nr:hypothetical protein BVRB_4g087660 [Beta vulgaris subsp. vulgaris]